MLKNCSARWRRCVCCSVRASRHFVELSCQLAQFITCTIVQFHIQLPTSKAGNPLLQCKDGTGQASSQCKCQGRSGKQGDGTDRSNGSSKYPDRKVGFCLIHFYNQAQIAFGQPAVHDKSRFIAIIVSLDDATLLLQTLIDRRGMDPPLKNCRKLLMNRG